MISGVAGAICIRLDARTMAGAAIRAAKPVINDLREVSII
jgi:hypothetical protein